MDCRDSNDKEVGLVRCGGLPGLVVLLVMRARAQQRLTGPTNETNLWGTAGRHASPGSRSG